MDLIADEIDSENNQENVSLGFYSYEKLYGVGFCRIHSERRIELMVADQSVYGLEKAEITFLNNYFELKLPSGTIRKNDGDDCYQIKFKALNESRYNDYLKNLKLILKVNDNVLLKHS